MFWRLVGGGGEIGIAETSFSATHPNEFLPVIQYFRLLFARLFVPGNGSQRHFDDDVFAKPAGAVIAAACLAIFRQYVLIVAQV